MGTMTMLLAEKKKSPALTKEHGRIEDNEVGTSVGIASENHYNNKNNQCFVSSTKLASSALVKPVCHSPTPKISIQASSHK